MKSQPRVFFALAVGLLMTSWANAQLTCNGSLGCNSTTPAYSFTNSGSGTGLNVTGGSGNAINVTTGSSGKGIKVTQNSGLGTAIEIVYGGGVGISATTVGGGTAAEFASAFGKGIDVFTSSPLAPAIEAQSNYYHGMEVFAGKNSTQPWHAVRAIQQATSGTAGYGVYGESSRNTGVYGKALLSGQYGVYASGNLGASGTKSFVEPHPYDATKQIQYAALEGPEAGTYFRGTVRIVGGFARIPVPEDFRIVTDEKGLTVQVTPVGELALVACTKKGLDEIEIQGTKDVEVDFLVHGVRRAFVDFRPVVENRQFVPESRADVLMAVGLPAESARRLKANGTINEDGTINLETARRLGWDKQESWERKPTEQR